MQVGSLIRTAARRYGDAPCLTAEERTVSFAEFDQATDRVGNALLAGGMSPGDRVGVLLPNGIEGLVVYYALAKAGLVRVPLNHRETPAEWTYKLQDSGSRGLVHSGTAIDGPDLVQSWDPDWLERTAWSGPAEPCDVHRDVEAPYRLGYTGGTTGKPKGAVLTMRSEHAELAHFLVDLLPGVGPGDVMLHAAPVIHASGAFFLPHLVRGAHNVVMTAWDPSAYLEELQRTGATASFLVPTMIAMAVDEPGADALQVPRLRRLCWGASPMAPSVSERAQQVFGQVLAQTYGQAEAPMAITVLQPDEHDRIGSAGRPYTLVEVRVVDEDDREVPVGESGEVVTRGQHVMSGYWNRPEASAETLRGGWLHTGDIGRMDDEGFLYLVDRRNDVIITGGSNVYPREIEDALTGHPAVREAAVVGLPSERWGEVVHAVVALRPGEQASTEDLLAFAADRVAGYKRPRSLAVWDALPKSPANKILRREVRDAERARLQQEQA
ncbi:Acyl-CoA synthetase (AMP-forming)/AMP-acid ligase II [Geodermatophilus amargosae]|uniref:Acyl-CoA synthetase (AMP-forming)/AMP-acid ligase II n=1 Tax=Geodermatophilus amargosae TaxID=1296565 RepID=A0A1I7BJH5_9ACTN|nr:AMP-binding protein [Geodermatophilus amargosae]SFT87297.1 Acyl-CoA synthetase (AMP-forming)/AMP-acid ligase II [Geodermatophilus amargosae]